MTGTDLDRVVDQARARYAAARLQSAGCLDAGFSLARRGFIALSIEITDADVDAFLDVVGAFDPLGDGSPT